MAHDLLHGYAAAAFERATDAGRLRESGADLEAFSRALTESEALRQALTDPLVPTQTRRAIVADLVAERATPEAGAVIDFALRVVRPAELSVAFADVEAFGALLADDGADAPTVGRAAIRARVRGYAERTFEELPEVRELDEVEDELFRFARLVEANPPLRHMLGDISAPVDVRCRVLADLLESKVRPATLRLVSAVVRAGVVRDLVGVYEWLVELAAEERGRRIAQVRAAVELSGDERDRLAASLSQLVHRDVEVRVIDDPSVIGGVLVSIGDLLIDGTVRLRFERLRDAIAQWS